jgi:tRNA (guanine37-N1)-methyltransferase
MCTGTRGEFFATTVLSDELSCRLSTEHSRLVDLIREVEFPGSLAEQTAATSKKRALNENSSKQNTKKGRGEGGEPIVLSSSRIPVIADMMGGVGPFGIPLAKLNLFQVHCNDLNPASYKYLLQNAHLNHCRLATGSDTQRGLSCYNLDGREFIRRLRREGIAPGHVIMNLPQTAPEFLDVFIGYFGLPSDSRIECQLPVIHVYAFSTAVDDLPHSAIADMANRCASVMRCPVAELGNQQAIVSAGTKLANLSKELMKESGSAAGDGSPFFQGICWGHIVRDVAPTKVMVCLSFQLPVSVARSDSLAPPSGP